MSLTAQFTIPRCMCAQNAFGSNGAQQEVKNKYHPHQQKKKCHLLTGTSFLLYVGDNSRKRAIVAGMTDSAKSTFSGVFCFPKLNRILARARSGGRPIAVSTCDGSIAPEEHAAPVETASPLRSSAITIASPSI